MRDPIKLVTEGYQKYRGGYFRISTLQGEYVLVTSRDKVGEYLRAPDDVLSMQEAANDVSTTLLSARLILVVNA
jgi:hypothetical protein